MKFKKNYNSSYHSQNEFHFSKKNTLRHRFPRWLILFSFLILSLLGLTFYYFFDSDTVNSNETIQDEIIQHLTLNDINSDIPLSDNIYDDVPFQNTNKQLAQNSTVSQEIDVNEKSSIAPIETTSNQTKKQLKPLKDKSLLPSLIEPTQSTINTTRIKIKQGDNLAYLFKQQGLSSTVLHNIVNNTSNGKQLTRIKAGQELTFTRHDNSKILVNLSLQKNILEKVDFTYQPESSNYKSKIVKRDVDKRQQTLTVTISDSLFLSAKSAGISDNLTMRIANLFAWDIDFALDIRKGDSFSVLYNEHYLDGEKISNGDILAAEFHNQNRTYFAILYTDKTGKQAYYNEKGYSKRKAFLRTPVAFTRISSRFSSGRRHPVLNKIRAHKGVDYAAPRGTPVKSVGDGKIIFKGRKGGYGRVLQVQHGSKYMTVYAHLNSYNKKIRHGTRVKQGQTIAYVGKSGLATGYHLHYEFRINGVHRNPLTVKLSKSNPIPKKYLKDFKQKSKQILLLLKKSKLQ